MSDTTSAPINEETTPTGEAPVEQPMPSTTIEASEAPVADSPAPVAAAAEAPVVEAPVAETPVADAPAAEATSPAPAAAEAPAAAVAEAPAAPAEPVMTEEEKAEALRKKQEERAKKEEERRLRDEAYAELEKLKEEKGSFEIKIQERVKGGLRGEYKTLRVFLPASHYGARKNVPEEELNAAVGQTVRVMVHELQSDDTGYKSAVVTRRDLLVDEFWNSIQPGTVFDGVVTSVTTFGAFVNIGGVEGLVHVSRLSKSRVESPADVVKKGDKLKVTVTEVDRVKHKLSLSHKEHEESPWKGAEGSFTVGKRIKGTVRRITDFGVYVQVAPRIEGLLRINELSWTRRIKHPSDVVSVGQEIEVEILNVSEEKQQLGLGYKQTLPNPWLTITETLPVGTETTGVVQQSSTQGAVVRIADTFDGFMPRSKMANAGRGQKVAVNVGDTVNVVVADLDPSTFSLIIAMKNEDGSIAGQGERYESERQGGDRQGGERQGGDRQGGGHRGGGDRQGGSGGGRRDRNEKYDKNVHTPLPPPEPVESNVSLMDMLSEKQKSTLLGNK